LRVHKWCALRTPSIRATGPAGQLASQLASQLACQLKTQTPRCGQGRSRGGHSPSHIKPLSLPSSFVSTAFAPSGPERAILSHAPTSLLIERRNDDDDDDADDDDDDADDDDDNDGDDYDATNASSDASLRAKHVRLATLIAHLVTAEAASLRCATLHPCGVMDQAAPLVQHAGGPNPMM